LIKQASHEALIKDAVAIEKARGVFLTHIQRKRFLQWREEQGERELEKLRYHNLGITIPKPPPLPIPKKSSEGRSTRVPAIVIDSKRTVQPRFNQDFLHPHSPRPKQSRLLAR
jgi:ATP-dependent RNA circularization protein (DNA/RNA ligase family)